MHAYEEIIRDWNDGKDWFDVPQTLKHEIAAQYLRDEGFLTAIAGADMRKFERIFGGLLADFVDARYTTPERFAEAGRKFASAAYAFIASELDDALREEWELATPETPDVDGPAEAQARHADFVAMVRS
jgi:hypothetical protein